MPPKKSSGGNKKESPAPTPPPQAGGKGSNPGKGKASEAASGRNTGGGSGGKQQSSEPPAPAGPTVKQIIGGPSWTGKLPVNLLSEHCQKNGWDGRVDYVTRRFPDGFLGSVTLRCKNPKTNLFEEVVFTPPRELRTSEGEVVKVHQPTPLEAKHLLATYALNRVANMINIRFMLPPSHQAFWKVFEEHRKIEMKEGKSWMYEADPFVAQRERKAFMDKIEKDRSARAAAAESAASGGVVVGGGRRDWNERMKGWQHAPNAEMGKDMRVQVESLIRKYHTWNPDGIAMSDEVRRRAIDDLMSLGFRKSHVEEGCDWTADREECLGELLRTSRL